MEKLSGINCVLSTDSMCKKVTFLGNITDPSHERNSGGYEIFRWEYFWQNYYATSFLVAQRYIYIYTRTSNSREY